MHVEQLRSGSLHVASSALSISAVPEMEAPASLASPQQTDAPQEGRRHSQRVKLDRWASYFQAMCVSDAWEIKNDADERMILFRRWETGPKQEGGRKSSELFGTFFFFFCVSN